MTNATPTRAPDTTRRNILNAAFLEFYHNGFQGGSLNEVVRAAGITKGALFHHFAGKQELGYAVLDEVIDPLLSERWLHPIIDSADPITDLQRTFRHYIRVDIETGFWAYGCPLNNLAQEMSPLDEGFRARIDRLYARWRQTIATTLTSGITRGVVRADIDPHEVAALVVAMQMGTWGTGKYSHDKALMTQAGEALCQYLETLRPRARPAPERGEPQKGPRKHRRSMP